MKTKIWPIAVIFLVFVLSLCGCGQTVVLTQTEILTIAGPATVQTTTVTVTAAPVTVTVTSPVTISATPTSTTPTGQISNAAIRWTSPNQIIFTWSVINLSPNFEYWVYPRVGFTENSGPFGSTPQDEANSLEGMYDLAITHFRSAPGGTGMWNWGGGKPTNPTGQLALLAYNPVTHKAFVVALSSPINTSSW
jgi:hypothetical protein